MTDMMERNDTGAERDAIAEYHYRRRGSEDYIKLVHETFISIIREAAPTGGIGYDAALGEAYRRLRNSYTHLDHSHDFFDNFLNSMSISREIDSGRGHNLFVSGEQPWLRSKALGHSAIERASD